MSITDQLAQALEEIIQADIARQHGASVSVVDIATEALEIYRASKEGEGWRMLKEGENIQDGDECLWSAKQEWKEARLSIGEEYSLKRHSPHRRPIRAT